MSQKIITFIKDEFEKRRSKNPKYSIRAFAALLEINSGTYSSIISGKRAMTFEQAAKILKNLNIQDSIRNNLLLTIDDEQNYDGEIVNDIILSENESEITNKWEFAAIFATLTIAKMPHTPEAISNFLGINLIELNQYLVILNKLKMIQFLPNGTITHSNNNVRSFHHKWEIQRMWLNKALEFVEKKTKPDVAEFTGFTFAAPVEKIPELKRRINEFFAVNLKWITSHLDTNNQVFRMNVHFFPLTEKPYREKQK